MNGCIIPKRGLPWWRSPDQGAQSGRPDMKARVPVDRSAPRRYSALVVSEPNSSPMNAVTRKMLPDHVPHDRFATRGSASVMDPKSRPDN